MVSIVDIYFKTLECLLSRTSPLVKSNFSTIAVERYLLSLDQSINGRTISQP